MRGAMRRAVGGWSAALVSLVLAAAPLAGQPGPGVPPRDATRCPDEHPIKGHASRHAAGGGVYYAPGTPQYDAATPERCFATEAEERGAGYQAGRGERRPARDRR